MNKIITTILLLSLNLGIFSCDERISRSYEVVDPELEAAQDTATTISERSRKRQGVKQVNESINGEIIYTYKKDSTGAFVEKVLAFKYDDQDEFFRISIKNDTINLNEQFEGFIFLDKDLEDYELKIEKDGNLKQIPKDNLVKGFHYKFTPQSKGLNKFAGVLKYKWQGDWKEHPFNYNYIVK